MKWDKRDSINYITRCYIIVDTNGQTPAHLALEKGYIDDYKKIIFSEDNDFNIEESVRKSLNPH